MWLDMDTESAMVTRHWREAPSDPDTLAEVLDAAQLTVERYAPAPKLDAVTGAEIIPTAWKLALIYQAREVYQAATRNGGVIPTETYAIRPRPLADSVKQLLRPQRGRKAIG